MEPTKPVEVEHAARTVDAIRYLPPTNCREVAEFTGDPDWCDPEGCDCDGTDPWRWAGDDPNLLESYVQHTAQPGEWIIRWECGATEDGPRHAFRVVPHDEFTGSGRYKVKETNPGVTGWHDFDVTLTLRLSIHEAFAPPQDSDPQPSDAVANAIGRIPESVFADLRAQGFEIAMPIDGEAVRED